MTKVGLYSICAGLVLACGAAFSQRGKAEVSAQVSSWTFPAAKFSSIVLKNDAGNMVLRASTGNDITIKAEKKSRSAAEMDLLVVEPQPEGEQLTVSVRLRQPASHYSASVDYVVEAPPGLAIKLNSSSGNLTVEGYSGKVEARTSSGEITLLGLNGEVDASSSSGNLKLKDSDGEIRAGSASGNVEVSFSRPLAAQADAVRLADVLQAWSYKVTPSGADFSSPRLRGSGRRIFSSASGDVILHLSQALQADVYAQAASKKVRSAFAGIQPSAPDGILHYGSVNGGGALIILTTASGQVSIKQLP